MTKRLHRRTMLRGAGVALALPMLEIMRPRTAHAASPRRFITWWTPNGTINYAWNCSATDAEFPATPTANTTTQPALPTPPPNETDFKLSRILSPLERHKKDLTVIQNVDLSGKGYAHWESTVHQLVGRRYRANPTGGIKNMASAISLDQALAGQVGKATRFASLQLGVNVGANTKYNEGCISFTEEGAPLLPQDNVYEVYRSLFGDLAGGDKVAIDRLRAMRRSVLDSVLENATILHKRLGVTDRQKLDQHTSSIREIEQKLDTAAAPGGRCVAPAFGTDVLDWKKNDNVPLLGKLQMDLMVAALSCDLTRIVTFMWAKAGGGGRSHTWVPGGQGDWHAISHQGDKGDYQGWDKQIKVNTWYSDQLAYLADKMKAIKEDDGTLLDNSLVFVTNEYGNGVLSDSHYHQKLPLLMLGRGGGQVRSGRHLAYPKGTLHNGILVAVATVMGMPGPTYGDPVYGTGPLPRLLA